MSDTNGYVTAQELIETYEMDFEIGSSKYRIRRIDSFEVMSGLGKVVDVSSLGANPDPEVLEKTLKNNQATLESQIERVIKTGLVIPKIGENGLEVKHIPYVHQQQLFSKILDISGVSPEATKRTAPFDTRTSEDPSTSSANDTDDSHTSSSA